MTPLAEFVALCRILEDATLIVAHVGEKRVAFDPKMFAELRKYIESAVLAQTNDAQADGDATE